MKKNKYEGSQPILISQVVSMQGGFYISYNCKKESSLEREDYEDRECTNDTRSGLSLIADDFSGWKPRFITKLMKNMNIDTRNEFNEYIHKHVFEGKPLNQGVLDPSEILRWVDGGILK